MGQKNKKQKKGKNMFAVIKNGGRQYKVSVDQTLEVNRLPVEDGEQIRIEDVLLISDADRSMVGTPLVENAAVLATVVKKSRGEKLIVFRYKAKKRFRHKRGHRQELTVLHIDDIIADGKSLITGEEPKARVIAPDEGVATGENAENVTPVEETPNAEQGTSRRRRTTESEGAEGSESTKQNVENKTEE